MTQDVASAAASRRPEFAISRPRHATFEPGARTEPGTLLEIFRWTVAAHPGRPALEAPDATLSYAQLDRRAREVAGWLRDIGVGPGDRVGIRLPSGTAALYTAILGVLTAGAAYVPVDADDPDARAEWIWEEADVTTVIDSRFDLALRGYPGHVARPVRPDDDAWVIFTSGSTGRPKGVAVSHRAAAAFVAGEARLLHLAPEDRVLAGLSVAFDASCEEMWLAWRNGAALVPAPRAMVRSGADLGPWLAERRITVVSTVPTLAGMWATEDLAQVRLLILGGEACSNELGWRLAAGREVWNTYGPTEATVVTTATRIIPGEPVTIGEPLHGWRVAVVDDTERPVPPGTPGELIISGVGLARYLDPALDARSYAAVPALGWSRAYRAGDFVRQTPSGLEFIGRRDDQVKIGGRRIDLSEIQTALTSTPGVRAAAALTQRTPAGNLVLAGYVVPVPGVAMASIRAELTRRLPQSLVPVLIEMDLLPVTKAGKLDRQALPWPPPRAAGTTDDLAAADRAAADRGAADRGAAAGRGAAGGRGTEGWLADQWAAQLGVRPGGSGDDFFELGGSSLTAAKLVSVLRERFPGAAVADIYSYRTLGGLAGRLGQLGAVGTGAPGAASADRREAGREGAAGAAGGDPARGDVARGQAARGGLQLAGVGVLLALGTPSWVLTVFIFDGLTGGHGLPTLAWPWLVVLWLAFLSTPGRVLQVAAARWLLLRRLVPGRYPRRSWLGTRVWFIDRLADQLGIAQYGGTSWACAIARLTGAKVGAGASLGVIPSPAGLVSVGAGATLEADADVHGWWVEGGDLVVGQVTIGAGARVGTRAVIMPGIRVGDGAEVEPGSVVSDHVPPGQRWAGSPARLVGRAGDGWPAGPPPAPRHRLLWNLLYAVSVTVAGFLPLIALLPSLALAVRVGNWDTMSSAALNVLKWSPALTALFVTSYAVITAILVRWLGRWLRPGWHSGGATAWAAWTREELLGGTRTTLFPLYSSLYTKWWLRLMGIKLGSGSEMSTAIGLSPLVRFGAQDFIADDVVFNAGRARGGWLHLRQITLGDGVFLGNGALINGGTELGTGSLVGVQTTPPADTPGDTSWFGLPAIEFPRVADQVDPRRTVAPTAGLVAGRAVMDLIRIMGPAAVSMMLASGVLVSMDAVGSAFGGWAMLAAAPFIQAAAGVLAVLATAAVKWGLMGAYRAGEHPLWSWFVWRDEILNSAQEELAGPWLLDHALGTPVMSAYLRLMGTRVGRDVWCDTLTITEFDMVTIGDGCAINRRSCIETHLFQDRLMRIGPIRLGAGATVGPATAVLPDTILGDHSCVGARSVVLRGETLAPGTRWHGAPVSPM